MGEGGRAPKAKISGKSSREGNVGRILQEELGCRCYSVLTSNKGAGLSHSGTNSECRRPSGGAQSTDITCYWGLRWARAVGGGGAGGCKVRPRRLGNGEARARGEAKQLSGFPPGQYHV